MKKALLIGIFSLLALAPFRCALAQAGSDTSAVKTVERSSAGVGSTAGERNIQDPAPEAVAGNATAKNQTTSPTFAESTEAISSVLPKAESAAQRNYNAGVALYDSGKLVEAISAFKEANMLKPNDPQTQYMLGMVYWKTKAFDDSVDFFKRAVRLRPDWAEAHFRLGLAYYVLGRKALTNEAYKRLVELNSPLANKLYRINNEAYPTNVVETLKARPAVSTGKQVEVVPVSASAAGASLSENRRPTATESNGSSTTAASSNKAIPAVAPPSEEPAPPASESDGPSTTAASSNKAIPAVAPPNEKPSPATSESNHAPTGPISTEPATVTVTAPVTRTANVDSASGNKAIATDDSAPTDVYKVGIGDVLDIRLLNSAANRSTLYSVVEGGLIDFPIAGGPLPVAGLTTKDIQASITAELKQHGVEDRTQVAVGVRQYASHTVIITGLVSSPGTKILRREAVPLYVLLAEVQPRLDAARAAIVRAGAPTQVVDLSDSAALNFLVRPGDVINLTARPQEFYYIGGRISYPGQKTFQPGITLVQAIFAAGGLAQDNVVEVSREGLDSRLVTSKLNLKEIKSGKIRDPKLRPGDRIEVLH